MYRLLRNEARESRRSTQDARIAFALAFLDLGPMNPDDEDGPRKPGEANQTIAALLEEHKEQFSFVMTQRGVSDALNDPTQLGDGTPVYQMHLHKGRFEVRTFAALRCALDRLRNLNLQHIVLIAHPKQLRRANMILRALDAPKVVVFPVGSIGYEDDHWTRPLFWTAKNAAA